MSSQEPFVSPFTLEMVNIFVKDIFLPQTFFVPVLTQIVWNLTVATDYIQINRKTARFCRCRDLGANHVF